MMPHRFCQIFKKIFKYQISWKSVQWEPSCFTGTDWQIEMTKLIVAFHNSANAPKNTQRIPVWKTFRRWRRWRKFQTPLMIQSQIVPRSMEIVILHLLVQCIQKVAVHLQKVFEVWKWRPRASMQPRTCLIVFANTFCRSACEMFLMYTVIEFNICGSEHHAL